jgi:hypothetical protein
MFETSTSLNCLILYGFYTDNYKKTSCSLLGFFFFYFTSILFMEVILYQYNFSNQIKKSNYTHI